MLLVYPASPKNLNLRCISDLKDLNVRLAFLIIQNQFIQVLLQLRKVLQLLENICIFKKDKTLDNHFSIDIKELKEMVKGCNEAWETIAIKIIVFQNWKRLQENLREP